MSDVPHQLVSSSDHTIMCQRLLADFLQACSAQLRPFASLFRTVTACDLAVKVAGQVVVSATSGEGYGSGKATRVDIQHNVTLDWLGEVPVAITFYGPRHFSPPNWSVGQWKATATASADFLLAILQRCARDNGDALRHVLYYHQYIHGISAIRTNVAGVARLLRDSVLFGQHARAREESVAAAQRAAIGIVDTLSHLVDVELYGTLNMLSQAMPDYTPGVARAHPSLANPMHAVRDVLPGYVAQAEKRGVVIEFDHENLSERMPLIHIEGGAFQRMWHNLLSNALKYSYHGIIQEGIPRRRTVRIWCRPRHDVRARQCMIAIQNYGLGIASDELPLVRMPGYRGRLARDEVQVGTGLGLSEADKVAQQHGGHLSIESSVVHEDTYLTTVRVVLPRGGV